jgi:hypothetical protein
MTTATISPTSTSSTVAKPPSWLRRTAVGVTALLACALPVVFTVNITRMLVTGVEPDHRFHQATGQGLILFALWLGALLPLVRAAWSGRRPSTATGLLHLAFAGSGVVCAALAPGGGAPFLVGVIVITGALLWLAMPLRPRLRGAVRIDPVLAPIALALAAFLTPYALGQIALQNLATTGHHAQNPHLFDMAWLAVTLIVLAVLAALLPAARSLVAWVSVSSLGLGVAGLAFGEGSRWSLLALGFGVVFGVAGWLQRGARR